MRSSAPPRQLYGGGTSISGAIDHAVTLFPESGAKGGRRVIDVRATAPTTAGGRRPMRATMRCATGVTINGLPIMALEPGLDQYYQNNVIGGPNAFMIVAETYETFAEAVLKKLITEIAALSGGGKGQGCCHGSPLKE